MSKTSIPIVDGELVIAKDELAYQCVVDDFPNAERIAIATYNVSSRGTDLLKALAATSAHVTIITNIPKRFDSYFGRNVDQTKKYAKWQISQYTERLDPTTFDAVVETYFCFDNHAKIVMTDNIAFLGSANYSEESSNNWECGVITTDPSALADLQAVVDQLKGASLQYLGKPTKDLVNPFMELRACLETIEEKATEECLDNVAFWLHELEQAIAVVDRTWWAEFEPGGPLTSRIDLGLIEKLSDLISESDALREYARFDPERIYVDDLPSDAYGDKLQTYLEQAGDDNSLRLEEFEEKARGDIRTLRHDLSALCSQLEDTWNSITESHSSIDNTD